MLELHINDTNVTSGSIPISWCIDKATLDKLAEDGVVDPQIIICIAPVNGYHISKEVRKVVPLKDLMTYVEFHCAGPNKIYAFLPNPKEYSKKDSSASHVKNRWYGKVNGEYYNHLLDHDGSDYYDVISLYESISIAEPLIVDVPAGSFAKEPPAWEKAWTNHFFRDKSVDQCSYRRRRLMAYTIQPIIMFAQFILEVVTTVIGLLFGLRGISLKPFIHPLTYNFVWYWDELWNSGSIFVNYKVDLNETHETFKQFAWAVIRKFWRLPFMPFIFGILFTLYKTGVLLKMACGVGAVLILVCILAMFISGAVTELLNKLFPPKQELWYLDPEEEELLICTGEKKPVKLSSLPKNHRTVKLRFYDLKSKVCKPFSR